MVLGGLVSLLGWMLDVQVLADWDGDGITIQPNTCVASMAFGLGVLCLARERRRGALFFGALATAIGATALFEHATHIDLGIDTLLMFDRTWVNVAVTAPGRMGLPAASSSTVLGTAILLCATSRYGSQVRNWAAGLALMTMAIAGLSLIGYLYGAAALYTIPSLTAIANQTASFLLCASLALIVAVPERGPMRLFADPGAAGILARRLLPAIVVLPILIGLLRLAGFRAGLYDAEFGTALRTVCEIALFLLFVWWTAGTIQRQDERRKEAEGIVADRERALREAQRLAQIGSWDWDARTGRATASEELRSIYGVSADETFPSFTEQRGRFYEPHVWSKLDAAFQGAMRTGQGFQMDVEARRNGERIWVAVRCETICDEMGHVIGTRGTVQDRSARVKSDEVRMEQERLLLSVTEHAQVGLVIVDRQHRYLYANRAYVEVLGLNASSIVGRPVSDVLGESYVHQVRPRLERAFAGDHVQWELNLPAVSPSTRSRSFSVTYTPQPDEAGVVTSVVVAVVDVSHQHEIESAREAVLAHEREARSEAERAVRIKDEFLATLSHELRTPLNAMLGWAQILRTDADDPVQTRSAAEVIERNGRAQAQLITDLLDMSRIMSGKMALEVKWLDIEDILVATIESMMPAAAAKGIRIERRSRSILVVGDPDRLQQVVWNLLSNAVKFTPRGGTVSVDLVDSAAHVEVRITDTGEGIAPEFLPHMFERFRQADSSASRMHGGLGIGLALVKQLTELHGGRVHASSRGKGFGATFVVELPHRRVAPLEEPEGSRRPGVEFVVPSGTLAGRAVLVVDDEPDALLVVRRMLESQDADVATAMSSEEALGILRTRTFDLVISDLGMPGIDGHRFLRRARADGMTSPALALSALAHGEDRIRSKASGYQMHLAKPVDAGGLLEAVLDLVRKRGERGDG